MQLDTIAIVSPKDPTQRVLINVIDFVPGVHITWEDREQGPVLIEAVAPVEEMPKPVSGRRR